MISIKWELRKFKPTGNVTLDEIKGWTLVENGKRVIGVMLDIDGEGNVVYLGEPFSDITVKASKAAFTID